MICPKCGGRLLVITGVHVTDTEYKRYRRCEDCYEAYRTREILYEELKQLREDALAYKAIVSKVREEQA